MLKTHVDTRFLSELLHINMLRFCNIFFVFAHTFMIKILGFIAKYAYRSNSSFVEENGSNFSGNYSQENDQAVSENSKAFLSGGLGEEEGFDDMQERRDFDGNESETEDSVLVRSSLVGKSSKYEFVSGENVRSYVEEPETVQFTVQEMFVGSDEVCDHEFSERKDSLEQKFEETSQESDEEESEFSSFSFNLFNTSLLALGNIDQEKMENPSGSLCNEQAHEEEEKPNTEDFRVEGIDNLMDDEILEDQDVSYEVELLPFNQSSRNEIPIFAPKLESNDRDFLEINCFGDANKQNTEDLDDEYIELELQTVHFSHQGKECFIGSDANKAEDLETSSDGLQETKNSWDYDSDSEDEAEEDALSEHQNLVQQMKMELKNCRIKGLPTIEEECESPKMVEDLRPLQIDHKFEYKDVMDEIQKFYKCYLEKMRKLDILNYQTLHAISFQQLKDSEVFSTNKKKSAPLHFNLPQIWPCKVQRIYADPMHKSVIEMHRDLELVYVGQLCLSWEILSWLYAKARELLEYDCNGSHAYNRVAEEFQQFQVLMQRFMEDEPFQGVRIQNYVKSRCMIRSLLQVPSIKDDCLKDKKERSEETDAISLEALIEIIRESMLIFRDFLWADKRSINVVMKGIHGTKIDLDQDHSNSELLVDIITNLQKKEKRIRESIRSANCIVKKLKKPRECRLDNDVFTSQVELRLVSRVLRMSRLTRDQLVWCKNKVSNISILGRKVHVESSFLLFPC